VLLFAWCWLLLTTLPVAFIAHYAAFLMYLPAVGWALYVAILLVAMRRAFIHALPHNLRARPMLARAPQAVLILGLAAFLAPLHAREAPRALKHFLSVQPPSREITEDLGRLRLELRRGARVLFVNDRFPKESYFLLFTTRLFYRDLTLEVERIQTQSVPRSIYSSYDAVFGFRGNRLLLLSDSGSSAKSGQSVQRIEWIVKERRL